MTESSTKRLGDGALLGGAGILSAVSTIDLPDGLGDAGEPIGLILALMGAVLKLVQYFQARSK